MSTLKRTRDDALQMSPNKKQRPNECVVFTSNYILTLIVQFLPLFYLPVAQLVNKQFRSIVYKVYYQKKKSTKVRLAFYRDIVLSYYKEKNWEADIVELWNNVFAKSLWVTSVVPMDEKWYKFILEIYPEIITKPVLLTFAYNSRWEVLLGFLQHKRLYYDTKRSVVKRSLELLRLLYLETQETDEKKYLKDTMDKFSNVLDEYIITIDK